MEVFVQQVTCGHRGHLGNYVLALGVMCASELLQQGFFTQMLADVGQLTEGCCFWDSLLTYMAPLSSFHMIYSVAWEESNNELVTANQHHHRWAGTLEGAPVERLWISGLLEAPRGYIEHLTRWGMDPQTELALSALVLPFCCLIPVASQPLEGVVLKERWTHTKCLE